MEDCLEVREFVHHDLVGVSVGALEDGVDFTDEVFHDAGMDHKEVELPGEALCCCVTSRAVENES